MAVEIGILGGSVQPGVPHTLFALGTDPSFPNHSTSFNRYAVSPDGQRFLIAQAGNAGPAGNGGLSDVLITAADSASTPASANGSVTVVLNWLAAVKTAKH